MKIPMMQRRREATRKMKTHGNGTRSPESRERGGKVNEGEKKG